MKRLLISVIMLVTQVCNAQSLDECRAEVNEIFAKFKVAAVNILPPPQRHILADVKLVDKQSLTYAIATTSIASADVELHEIQIVYEKVCTEPTSGRQGMIAHELGHFIVFVLYPKYGADMYHTHYHKITYEMQEAMANQYGPKVFRDSGISSDAYLELLDCACAKGSQYHCLAAENWRIGLTY